MIIAIDGYSSCGKSTLAKSIAAHFNFIFIDTGAMYRAVTLYFIQHEIALTDEFRVAKALDKIDITFDNSLINGQITLMNGKNVTKDIRTSAVNERVSFVAKIPAVREKLVAIQRLTAKDNSVVMDGRDIGTVVFPDADMKFFVTASIDERVRRRFAELQQKGIGVERAAVKKNLLDRDHIDSTREHSPLRKASNAYTLDNTYLNKEEQLQLAIHIIQTLRD